MAMLRALCTIKANIGKQKMMLEELKNVVQEAKWRLEEAVKEAWRVTRANNVEGHVVMSLLAYEIELVTSTLDAQGKDDHECLYRAQACGPAYSPLPAPLPRRNAQPAGLLNGVLYPLLGITQTHL
ncbi:hypothetical protein K1719_040586 [Acacia pycnantha]|nr:hypothetical protein K1719_040586 [Acacia pycnantha]